jgi:uncharacterized protein (TIGR03000 family)
MTGGSNRQRPQASGSGRAEMSDMRLLTTVLSVSVSVSGLVLTGHVEARAAQAAAAVRAPVASEITVRLPRIDTEVSLDGQLQEGSGADRKIETPPVEPGREVEYQISAKWRPNNYTVMTRTRVVRVRGGDRVTVDMTEDGPDDRAEIRFVPTPDSVVAEMIKMAGVTAADVVYEPGCGDGRITIAAVKAGARRGVGIDLDPVRVTESRANVRLEGLSDRIEIRQGDALDIKDLSEASVVFLYMGNEFDMLIRPILWRQLKVGARVVSHRFTMGDWDPDETRTVFDEENGEILVHRWTITQAVKDRAARQ